MDIEYFNKARHMLNNCIVDINTEIERVKELERLVKSVNDEVFKLDTLLELHRIIKANHELKLHYIDRLQELKIKFWKDKLLENQDRSKINK